MKNKNGSIKRIMKKISIYLILGFLLNLIMFIIDSNSYPLSLGAIIVCAVILYLIFGLKSDGKASENPYSCASLYDTDLGTGKVIANQNAILNKLNDDKN